MSGRRVTKLGMTALVLAIARHALAFDPLLAQRTVPANASASMIPGERQCEFGAVGQPLALREAVERTLCHNPKTREAWANVKAQAAAVGVARAALLPTVSGNWQGVRDDYLNAYNAIYSDIKSQPGVDPGTVNWFSQAGLVNTQLFNATPAGTWIYNYMFAAAQSEGATLNNTIFQEVSDTIAQTVFKEITKNNGVFDTNAFSPANIVTDDAGAGIGLLQSMFPNANLDYAIWGGTLFTSNILNDPSYYSTYSIDTSNPSTRDCQAIDAGFMSAATNTAKLLLNNPQYLDSAGGTALKIDSQMVAACMYSSQVFGSNF